VSCCLSWSQRKREALKDIETHQDKVDLALVALNSFINYSQQLTQKGVPCDISRDASSLRDRADVLLQTYVTSGGYSAPDVIFSPINIEELLKAKGEVDCLVGKIHVKTHTTGQFMLQITVHVQDATNLILNC